MEDDRADLYNNSKIKTSIRIKSKRKERLLEAFTKVNKNKKSTLNYLMEGQQKLNLLTPMIRLKLA